MIRREGILEIFEMDKFEMLRLILFKELGFCNKDMRVMKIRNHLIIFESNFISWHQKNIILFLIERCIVKLFFLEFSILNIGLGYLSH